MTRALMIAHMLDGVDREEAARMAGAPPLPTPPGANGPWTPIGGFQRPAAFGGVKGQSPLQVDWADSAN